MKKQYALRISQKIMGGFLALIFIFILNAITGLFTLHRSSSIIAETSKVIDPSRSALNEFNLLVTNSRMHSTNWVYLRSSTDDKEALKKLHESDYPKLKMQIAKLKPFWNSGQQQQMDSIFSNFEALLAIEKEIMADLITFEDYEDGTKKFTNETTIESEVLPRSKQIQAQLSKMITGQREASTKADANLLRSFDNVRAVTLGAGLLTIIVGLLAAFLLTTSITTPINHIKNVVQQLGKGELPQSQQQQSGDDEIGQMADAVNKLVDGLRSTSGFAENIGNGNYQADFTPLSENDVLGNALINMRNNLEKVAEADKRRNWTTEGIARFGEILRKNNDNLTKLADEIIANLVKYTRANQGGLFIINNMEAQPFLELKSCYAWDKKKYLEQKIYAGEGLTGQAWQEKEKIYVTEVPNDYITITSGLGEANPRSVLIVPLKLNDEIYGIIEMASFNEFASYEIEFVEKIAESIASTVSSAKINERTQYLLEDSTILTEQMRAQEEEMRQNMEELQATQEEMQRAQHDAKTRGEIFDKTQFVIEFDTHYKITYANQLVQQYLSSSRNEIIGAPVMAIFDLDTDFDRAKQILSRGQIWTSFVHVKDKNGVRNRVKASAGVISDDNSNDSRYLLILDGMETSQN